MNASPLPLIIGFCLALAAHAAEPSIVKPGSEDWQVVYEPAYQKPTELEVGSDLRKTLFELIRPRVTEIAKQPVKFQGSLRVFRNWAFFGGNALDSNEKPLQLPEDGNSDTVALWLRTLDGWRLVDFAAGHSDAFFIIWPEQYGVPAELLQ